jgi:asparagine synthase (glutamine-hydrolysing)
VCGVFGILSRAPVDPEVLEIAELAQRHRGPDSQARRILPLGKWYLGLAHQRLAIIDLSNAGEQPMLSPSGNSLIIYNGEVYNYLEMRAELESRGVRFRTGTDTEVVAAACEFYGVAEALNRMNGMWAFAWVNLVTSRVVLARDRFGVKPLYLWRDNGRLAFASEIKTLLRALKLRCDVDLQAVSTFLASSQVDVDDGTFFAGVEKLTPGHYLELDAGAEELVTRRTKYWSLDYEGMEETVRDPVDATRELLEDAVRLRLRSDVPVGLLLSGGVDSSAIAAVADRRLGRHGNLAFISAVSEDPASDESPFIDALAAHLARPVQKVNLRFPQGAVIPLIERVVAQNDEPLGGFACVAQYLLMERAREIGVTVLLSGQGADEVFCGYRKYAAFQIQALLRSGRYASALGMAGGLFRQARIRGQFRLAEARRYLPAWLVPTEPEIRGKALADVPAAHPHLGARRDLRDRQRIDIESLSVPALTHWEDRNSMAWSREVRNPFLDYRLVRHGVAMDAKLKVARGWTKLILREAIVDLVPARIAWRRDKRGFTTPEGELIRNELHSWFGEFLSSSAEIVRRNLVDPICAARRLKEFLRSESAANAVGSRDIFQLLSLELWLRAYGEHLSG